MRTGVAHGAASQPTTQSGDTRAAVAPLPAVNRPRNTAVTTQRDKTADQLAALSKYAARIAKIDVPYQNMGVAVTKKGPSAHANVKDKSDRATSEQVLDPRTRIILFKMIGRGLVQEVNGCVSTGKEVRFEKCVEVYRVLFDGSRAARQMYTMPLHPMVPILRSRYTRPPF